MKLITIDMDALAKAIDGNTDANEQEARAIINTVLAAPMSQAEPEGWQPIETAPKDGTRVLLREQYNDVPIIGYYRDYFGQRFGKWCADQTNYDTDGNACVIDKLVQELISHWQPLPQAPKEQA